MLLLALLLAFPAVSPRGAVAAAHPLAAEAGASMLRRGGNAADAAIAAAFALSVVEPQSSGLGGGGFALIYTARTRQVHVLDFREVGPRAARPDMYVQNGEARQDLANAGPLSVAVPAAVKGYAELLKRFGKKPLAQVVSPAEQIALRGFQVNVQFVRASEWRLECLAADPEAARIFLRRGDDGEYEAKQPGDKLIQPDLARTLHAIGERGPDAFYKGRIAKSIVDTLAARGGVLAPGGPPTAQVVVQQEHGTTHVSAVDEEGNAVALNTTVNDAFGSCVVPKGTGFLLNDEMDDFAVAAGVPNAYGVRGDVENAPGPGKVPLSSMAPTFVFAPDGALLLAIGSSGGASIPTTVVQAIVHVIDDGMPVDRAIAQPRLHHNLYPDLVRVEPSGLEAATARALEQRGHKLQFGGEPFQDHGPGFFDTLWGKACGVQIDPDTRWRVAACDVRNDGGGAIP